MYYDVVQVQKVWPEGSKKKKGAASFVEPLKKIGFLAQFFNKDKESAEGSQNQDPDLRYLVLHEGRLLVINSIQESTRIYGSHFNVKDKDKLSLPKITWNGEIRSVRNLKDLLVIRLLGYKAIMQEVEKGSTS